jgi:hypothetical protein
MTQTGPNWAKQFVMFSTHNGDYWEKKAHKIPKLASLMVFADARSESEHLQLEVSTS